MQADFERLVVNITKSAFLNDTLQQITHVLKQQTDQSISSFVSQAYQSLFILEHKIWQLLSKPSDESFHQSYYFDFFQTFASFNKMLIFHQDDINDEIKSSLLIPDTTDVINSIFEQVEQSSDDNNPHITFASLWFDNLSFFIHEYPQSGQSPVVIHINQYIARHFILNEKFHLYLNELRHSQLPPTVFSAKQLFYMKTCPFSLNVYCCTNPSTFDCDTKQVLENIGQEHLQLIQIQSFAVELWSKELLACVTHLIGFMRAFLWWNGENGAKLKELFPTEKILCKYIQALVRILEYKPSYQQIMAQWFNDQTILMDSILLFLMNIVQTQNINWFFRSLTQLPDVLLTIAETSTYYRIYLCAYGILSEVLTDERLKELKITDSIRIFFFTMLEQAWRHPSKKYKRIPVTYFLRGFLNLSKNDFIQEGTAKTNKIILFIEMSEQYPVVYDIIWALSFNQDIQQQIRANQAFMSKLFYLSKECDNEQIRKSTHGILWNLDINHEQRSITTHITNENTFDLMISYAHKDKVLCKQLYDELIKGGYRVWIDFDQMHGNVMDAMAQAIDRSQTIIICMSEQYRKSNYCRAEAHYAFQRQRKIVPVLMQKHYKPDGWLLFLIGQLLYVDFTKYDFVVAMKMLLKELTTSAHDEISVVPVRPKEDAEPSSPLVPTLLLHKSPSSQTYSSNMVEWTQAQVHEWLQGHNLRQLSRLLSDCDGRSVMHLYKYMKQGQPAQILSLLHEDCRRRMKQSLSLIELSRFHSLMHQQKQPQQLTESYGIAEHAEF